MSKKLSEKIAEMNTGIAEIKPQQWDSLPDIDLYMDQVLKYMTRQRVEIDPEDELTASMVSNYVKSGTMPGANGKRYGREHLAYLTAIQTFKQVLSVKDTKALIEYNIADKDIKVFYDDFLRILQEELADIGFLSGADDNITEEQLGAMALRFAVSSYANKLICERLLHLAASEREDLSSAKPEKPPKPAKEPKQSKKKKDRETSESAEKE